MINAEPKLRPCPQILSSIEKIAEGKDSNGLFMKYVKKHVEKCSHCGEALDALTCYQDAVKAAYKDTLEEGESNLTASDLTSILDGISH
ncbi:MAG: hypothetical protein WCK51_06240 [Armatimonadota bacterium]